MDILDVLMRNLQWGDLNTLRLNVTIGQSRGITIILETLLCAFFWALIYRFRLKRSSLWMCFLYLGVVISVNTVIRGVDSVIAVLSKGYHGFAPFFYIEFALYSSISILHPLCSIFIFLITIWNRKTKRENIFYPLLIICSLLWGGFTVIYALNDADSFDPPNLTISLIFFVAHFVYIGVLVLVGVLLLTSIFKLFLQNDSQNRSSILLTVLFVASSNAIWIYSDVTCFERLLEHLKYGTLLFSYPQMSFYSNTTMDYEIHSSNSARQAQMSSRTILLVHQLFPVIYFAIAICVLLKLHYKRRIPKENKNSFSTSSTSTALDEKSTDAVAEAILVKKTESNSISTSIQTNFQPNLFTISPQKPNFSTVPPNLPLNGNLSSLPLNGNLSSLPSNVPCIFVVPISTFPQLYEQYFKPFTSEKQTFSTSSFINRNRNRPSTSPPKSSFPVPILEDFVMK